MKYSIDDIVKYLDESGIDYTIDRNPSPEKIQRIKERIKESYSSGLRGYLGKVLGR